MPTPTKGARLGGSPAHERHILANLATALFEHGAIKTTHAKARRLRPYAERLITKAKRGDLHARRQVMQIVTDKSVVHVLFTEIGPRFATRPGGYTRITKIGPRKGDNAPMAVIELVEPLAEQVLSEAEGATRRASRDRAATSAPAVDVPVTVPAPAPAEPADEVGTDPVQDEADADDSVIGETATDDSAIGETSTDDSAIGETATDDSAIGETATDDSVIGETSTDDSLAGETAAEDADLADETVDEAQLAADRAERAADEAEQAAAEADAAAVQAREQRGTDNA